MKIWRILLSLATVLALGCLFWFLAWPRLGPKRTVAQRLAQYGEAARLRLKPHFTKAGLSYPPSAVILVGLKEERSLQVYARTPQDKFKFVREYRVQAASGMAGPKLRQGDRQVPEGIYPIESLNPNSRFHLSLRVGYPNRFDREQAAREGRTALGGDIMIHGSSVSIGCLAMGDEAAEELFVLAADTNIANVTVILCPVDFRQGPSTPTEAELPPWSDILYAQLKSRLQELPVPIP